MSIPRKKKLSVKSSGTRKRLDFNAEEYDDDDDEDEDDYQP